MKILEVSFPKELDDRTETERESGGLQAFLGDVDSVISVTEEKGIRRRRV